MSLLQILPRIRNFCCIMELRGGTIIVALCGIMFGISRFLQLVGAERGTGNDFGIKGNPEDIAKVDSFLMVEGIILLVLHILLIIGTCLKFAAIIKYYVILNLINLIVVFMVTIIWISRIDPSFAFGMVFVEIVVLYLILCINSYYLRLTESTSEHE